jgi:hypothetical protein
MRTLHFRAALALLGLLATTACVNKTAEKHSANASPTAQASPSGQGADAQGPDLLAQGPNPTYWYQGKAEISTYAVTQERYGEPREAEQVNVFVTEDFSKQKQVKLDNAAAAGADRVPVLKLNSIRRFETGIYDYSIMQSIFSPTDGGPAIKSTCTVQDWCGQVFFQTNRTPDGYQAKGFSYFESEGDTDVKLPKALLEDELWVRLRLDPSAIPTGKQLVIPSAVYSRIRHKAYTALTAEISTEKGEKESILRVRYEGTPRSLSIRYETAFPYRILGWEEMDNARNSSSGTLKKTRMQAYWSENSNAFSGLRDSLGIGR